MSFLRGLFDYFTLLAFCFKHPGKAGTVTYIKYPPKHTFGGKRVLNLGCGCSTYDAPNVVNLDMYPGEGVNVVHDLSKTPLPFKDNEFDFIIANHILEHIPNWWECFKELARVLKVGGELEVWVPGPGSSLLGYRDHLNVINHCSFVGTRDTFRNKANLWEAKQRESAGAVFDLCRAYTQVSMASFWWVAMWPKSIQSWIACHLTDTVNELGFTFRKEPPLVEFVGGK